MNTAVYIGIDFGTSGARLMALNAVRQMVYQQALTYGSSQDGRNPRVWQRVLFELLGSLPPDLRSQVRAIAIDGTSSTVLLCDAQGIPLSSPLMYSDRGEPACLEQLSHIVPAEHCVLSLSSSLVKLLTLQQQPEGQQAQALLHQADWLAFLLHRQLGISDYHNALKLGYDPAIEAYPPWFAPPPHAALVPLLPKVLAPGTPVGQIAPEVATTLALPPTCHICVGTTDSIAAFIASGATQPGEAVTSLGSTLVLKLLSHQRIDQAAYGIYSHRLGNLWLTGGASNTGGAVLAHFFSPDRLAQLSSQISSHLESPLHYYPLLCPGERFPVNDPTLPPQLDPRPPNEVAFLHGLLESLARIEAIGYTLLQNLGASPLQRVLTAGGGAQNNVWQQIRQRHLGVPVLVSPQQQAAYGTALLAQRGLDRIHRVDEKSTDLSP